MPEHLFFRSIDQAGGVIDTGGMIQRVQTYDWSSSSLGPITTWPEALYSTVRLILLSGTPMAVLVGREGLVIHNDAIAKILGSHYVNILGCPVGEVLPSASEFFQNAISDCYETKSSRFHDEPIKLHRGALETAWFSLSFTPITDPMGTVCGILLVVGETTQRVRTMKALAQERQRMELALDAGGIIGTWDLDISNNQIRTDIGFGGLFGLSDEDSNLGVSNDVLAKSVHPEDHERVLQTLHTAIRGGKDYRCRYRAMTDKGDVRWFEASGRPIHDNNGNVVQLAGIVIDITEQKEAAVALEQSNLRFDILAESVPQIVWSTDATGRHDYFNGRWTEFTGIAPEDIEPTTWQTLVHPDDWDGVAKTWQECLTTGETYDISYRFRYWDGTYRWLWVLALPLRDHEGKIIRWYGTSSDIDAIKQLDEQRKLVSRELDHRIRNLFALVNGLVSLSAREHAGMSRS